jgi:hypothetical protein
MTIAKKSTKDARAELLELMRLAELLTDRVEHALGTVDELARRLGVHERSARNPAGAGIVTAARRAGNG